VINIHITVLQCPVAFLPAYCTEDDCGMGCDTAQSGDTPHGVTSQTTVIFISTAEKTSD